jgi:hypothetical protein
MTKLKATEKSQDEGNHLAKLAASPFNTTTKICQPAINPHSHVTDTEG